VRTLSAFPHGYRDSGPLAARTERVLAVGRVFLTTVGFVAIYLDPTEPSRLAGAAYGVLAGYATYSFVVLALVYRAQRLSSVQANTLHALDVLWTSALTLASDGPVSPFFLFFLFVLLASAYRWGFRETVATTVVIVGIVVAQLLLVALGPWHAQWFGTVDLDRSRIILRIAYLLLTGLLLGYLSAQEKQSRGELAAVAEIARQPRVDLGLDRSVQVVAENLRRTFSAAGVAIVVDDGTDGRARLWRLDRAGSVSTLSLDTAPKAEWLFEAPGRVWHVDRGPEDAHARWWVVEPGAWPARRSRDSFPRGLADASCSSITAADLGLPSQWTGRVYLFDIARAGSRERQLHFLDALTDQITAGLTNVVLQRRLRSQASAAERARVAREIHDGAIQTLFGVDLKIAAMLRPGSPDEARTEELREIQAMLRGEVVALRELMQALRPPQLDNPDQLADVLAAIVERFRRDSGLSARFVSAGDPCTLDPARALELARIVQEALVNARRHSRARNVLVRFTTTRGHHQLIIEDDGTGFEFEGQFDLEELDRRRIGPAVIKERVRSAGAELHLESRRDRGVRLEVIVEDPVHA